MLSRKTQAEIDRLAAHYPDISRRALRAYLEQYWFAERFLSPLLVDPALPAGTLLEVGPAEGGALQYFGEQGWTCYGIELSDARFSHSQQLVQNPDIRFYQGDITDSGTYEDYDLPPMDIILLRDVIEHIADKETALQNCFDLLKPGGKLYLSFPPKGAPYAGHQQTAESIRAKLPYLHLFPDSWYATFLRRLHLPESRIRYLLSTKETRLSVSEMLHLAKEAGFTLDRFYPYFSRPEYSFRFGIPVMKNRFHRIPLLGVLLTNGITAVLEKPVRTIS
ncbi:MAG: class I SAM-dependent methyltransferase [Candidatus Neomarinimicrobiota bacterium]|nr:MAG: class I SAM-dependent methyltransferase [Candidatus Neomarinimicrobiota bacterium]